jgi:hypothetical protein
MNGITKYTRQKSAGEVRCAKCGQTRQINAGTMLVAEGSGTIAPCCMSPHQSKFAAALKSPPASALAMERTLRPGEKLTGPSPKEVMESRQ